MQTFLPYKSFEKSAACLDYRRLGKQRVEAFQVLNVLLGRSTGWGNHPITNMWRGHEGALFAYMVAMCDEWEARGYNNTGMRIWCFVIEKHYRRKLLRTSTLPPWMGSRKFHHSHRSRLLQKDRRFYRQFSWNVPRNLPYHWPL